MQHEAEGQERPGNTARDTELGEFVGDHCFTRLHGDDRFHPVAVDVQQEYLVRENGLLVLDVDLRILAPQFDEYGVGEPEKVDQVSSDALHNSYLLNTCLLQCGGSGWSRRQLEFSFENLNP